MMCGCSTKTTRSLEPKQPNPRVVGEIGLDVEKESETICKEEERDGRLSSDDRACVFTECCHRSNTRAEAGEYER
jgi:hypothetical protein